MKRIISVLMCLCLILSTFTFVGITASAATSGYYTYTVTDGKATITNCSTSISGNITIPSTLGGYPVTSIGNSAFEDCTKLTSIEIGNGVTSIGYEAFYNCTSLTSITIPDSVTSIGYAAFERCKSLTSITIGDSVTSIGSSAFYDCTSLTSVTIGDSVTSIGYKAFYGCKSLTSITIPDSVTSIGDWAFYYCTSLTSVTIGDSVTRIGDYAFAWCYALTSITIPDSVTSIGYMAFSDCESLTSITIGDSVTSIGSYAFSGCDSLTSITIPNSVTSIGNYAFNNCYSLTSVTIGDSVTRIGNYAFNNCYSLTSVTIGDSVTSIGDNAFYNCTSLTSVTMPDSVTSIGSSAFYNTGYYNNSDNWENDVLYIGKYLIKAKYTISGDYAIKSNTRLIASYAFSNCDSLTSITIPNSVTSIGGYAFEDCTSLTSVTIGDSVTSIGNYAFSGCTSLTSINVSDNNTSYCDIDGVLFNKDKTKLVTYPAGKTQTIYTIPDSVTSIGSSAFEYCYALKSITIGDGVTSIGNYAFEDCTATFYCNCTNSYVVNYLKSNSKTYELIHDYNVLKYDTTEHWYKCSDCVSTSNYEYHIFKNYKSNNNATCTKNATETSKCEVCDQTHTREVVDSALGHEYSSEWSVDKQATCSETGKMSRHCVRYDECGSKTEEITTPKTKHTESDWEIVVEATENNDGIKRKICTVCKETLETEYFEYHTHSYEFEITKEATCEESGIKTYTCECGDSYTETISAFGHTVITDKAVAPTCTKTGLTQGKHCSVCGEVFVAQTVVPKKSHSYKWVDTKKATYFTTGVKSYKCSACGKVAKTTTIAKSKLKTPSATIKSGKKYIKVAYKKVTGATGFQVLYKKGSKSVTKTFKTAKSATKTISKLKKGTYKVYVRAYVQSGSKKAYSSWTKVKSVKVK